MSRLKRVEIVAPEDLNPVDIAAWEGFTSRRPDLIGPYFDVRYVMDIGQSVPDAHIARLIDEDGRIAGFLPYQNRGRIIQPLGAPLTDYHGVIADTGFEVDYQLLLRSLKADRLEFMGWVGDMTAGASVRSRTIEAITQIADLSDGYDAYFARQKTQHHKFYKNIGRCQRNVEKDFGGFAFSFEMVTPQLLEWVIEQKREQYARSGMHDVFGCGWTLTLLSQLAKRQDEGFGLRVGVLRDISGEAPVLVAAEICLMRGNYVHFWFPAYSDAYYRYSPGILLALRIMEHVAQQGVTQVDFGAGGEGYKHNLTAPARICLEGVIETRPHLMTIMADAVVAMSPVARGKLRRIRLSFERRLRIIRACETCPKGKRDALHAMFRRGLRRLSGPAAASEGMAA
ncbi:MAG: GNAT family N-acetyltransferase [Asticcacaulis sp.]